MPSIRNNTTSSHRDILDTCADAHGWVFADHARGYRAYRRDHQIVEARFSSAGRLVGKLYVRQQTDGGAWANYRYTTEKLGHAVSALYNPRTPLV